MNKTFNSKKILALLLALIMILSAIPLALAVPAEPAAKSAGTMKDGVDGGHYVHFNADYQNFTFIQDADNQEFQFTFKLGAKKAASINYAWIYADWEREQTITEPVGKNHSVKWSSFPEGLETGWSYADITVKFTGEGAKDYNTALKVIYDAGSTSFNDRWEANFEIPLTVSVIDKRALNQAISAAGAEIPEQNKYTADSWAAVAASLEEAKKYTGNIIAEQSVIDTAAANLAAAVNSLKIIPADYSGLKAAADNFSRLNPDYYAADKFEAVKTLAVKAQEALKPENALEKSRQSEIDKLAENLNNAIAALKILPCNYEDFNKSKSDAKAKLEAADIKDFTDTTVKKLNDAYTAAENILYNQDITYQPTVDEAEKAINDAIAGLILKPADYTELDKAAADAEAFLAYAKNTELYTAEAIGKLITAADAANQLDRNLTVREQSAVDAAARAVEAAMPGEADLRPAELTALKAAIEKAKNLLNVDNITDYTDETVDALRAALREAEALAASTPDIRQQKAVDGKAAALNEMKLVLKTGNYAALDSRIAEAQNILNNNPEKKYTRESINALKAALRDAKDVDRKLNTAQQNIIYAAEEKLAAAIKALVPYEKITKAEITHNSKVVAGDVVFEKVKWYKRYKSHSARLGYDADGEIKDVKWEYANWSADKPEAAIIDNHDGTATVSPNGRGIGARSVWVKLTVTDINGRTASDYVKVRFYKWDWQTFSFR